MYVGVCRGSLVYHSAPRRSPNHCPLTGRTQLPPRWVQGTTGGTEAQSDTTAYQSTVDNTSPTQTPHPIKGVQPTVPTLLVARDERGCDKLVSGLYNLCFQECGQTCTTSTGAHPCGWCL